MRAPDRIAPGRRKNLLRAAAAALLLYSGLAAAQDDGLAAAPDRPEQAADETTYRLTVGDMVDFDFLDDNEPPLRLVINDRGALQAPLLGAVEVEGLTMSEALERLRLAYVEGDLLVDPKIDLSIAAYRPVYVLGDVRKPGLIDYRPLLTVEQAVGLAGGLSTQTTSGEEQLMAEAALRGELRVIDADLAREAAAIARLRAQARDGTDAPAELDYADAPAAVRAHVTPDSFSIYAETERRLLEVERRGAAEETALLASEIAAREQQIALLTQRVENQTAQIDLRRSELERMRDLVQRGLQRSTDLLRLEREVSEAEGRVLDVSRQQAEARAELAQLRREQNRMTETRNQQTLEQLQERLVSVDRLLARRGSVEERVFLTANWEAERSRAAFSIETTYTIRRGRGSAMRVLSAERISELTPGDVLLVSIDLPSRAPDPAIR